MYRFLSVASLCNSDLSNDAKNYFICLKGKLFGVCTILCKDTLLLVIVIVLIIDCSHLSVLGRDNNVTMARQKIFIFTTMKNIIAYA